MMQCDHKNVFTLSQPQQPGSQQRPTGQIERLVALCGGYLDGLVCPILDWQLTEVRHRQRHGPGRSNDLHWQIVYSWKCGAQYLVTAHDFAQRLFKNANVQWSHKAEGRWPVVDRTSRFKAFQKPQSFLGPR